MKGESFIELGSHFFLGASDWGVISSKAQVTLGSNFIQGGVISS